MARAMQGLACVLLVAALLLALTGGLRVVHLYPGLLNGAARAQAEARHIVASSCTRDGEFVSLATLNCDQYKAVRDADPRLVALDQALRAVAHEYNLFAGVECGEHSVCWRVLARLVDGLLSTFVLVGLLALAVLAVLAWLAWRWANGGWPRAKLPKESEWLNETPTYANLQPYVVTLHDTVLRQRDPPRGPPPPASQPLLL